MMYVAGALLHERALFASLFHFVVMHPRGSVRKVPPYLSFFLRYLAPSQTVETLHLCRRTQISSAGAEGRRTGVRRTCGHRRVASVRP